MTSGRPPHLRLKTLVGRALLAVGFDLRMRTSDRQELDRIILPWFAASKDFRRVLFIGCEWYTRPYAKLFSAAEYFTLDIDPDRAFYGGHKHIVDSAVNLADHFDEGALDVVFFNGVYGYGINDRDSMQAVLTGIRRILRPGGVVLIGWDDLPERCPTPINEIPAFWQFDPWVFPPYDSNERRIPGEFKKVYDFRCRPMN